MLDDPTHLRNIVAREQTAAAVPMPCTLRHLVKIIDALAEGHEEIAMGAVIDSAGENRAWLYLRIDPSVEPSTVDVEPQPEAITAQSAEPALVTEPEPAPELVEDEASDFEVFTAYEPAPRVVCDDCGRDFAGKQGLAVHRHSCQPGRLARIRERAEQRSAPESTPVVDESEEGTTAERTCPECGFEFVSKSGLRAHLQHYHRESTSR